MGLAENFLKSHEGYAGLFTPPTCGLLEIRYATVFDKAAFDNSGKHFTYENVVVAELRRTTVRGLAALIPGAESEMVEQTVLIKNPLNAESSNFLLRFGERNALFRDTRSGIVFAGKALADQSLVTLVRPVIKEFQEYFHEELQRLQSAPQVGG